MQHAHMPLRTTSFLFERKSLTAGSSDHPEALRFFLSLSRFSKFFLFGGCRHSSSLLLLRRPPAPTSTAQAVRSLLLADQRIWVLLFFTTAPMECGQRT